MKQIIEESRFFEYDKSNTNKHEFFNKIYILDDIINQTHGKLRIEPNTKNAFVIHDSNYIQLYSDSIFRLIINDLISIDSKQFSFYNPEKTINIKIHGICVCPIYLEYVYGQVNNNYKDTAIMPIKQNITTKYDQTLNNIVINSHIYKPR